MLKYFSSFFNFGHTDLTLKHLALLRQSRETSIIVGKFEVGKLVESGK